MALTSKHQWRLVISGWRLSTCRTEAAGVSFLDTRLIELAAAMRPGMKLPNGGKHVLKELSCGFLTDSVVNRSKAYFPKLGLSIIISR